MLKDCSVSSTLEVTAENITLRSEDAGNPVTIGREDGFSGKSYGTNTDTVLLAVSGGRTHHTAGAVHIRQGGSLTMDGGLIQNCYAAGAGGGIQSEKDSHVSASSGTVTKCYAAWGGGMFLEGEAELSGMTISGNSAGSTGGICTKTGHRPKFIRCTFTGNISGRGSAIQTLVGEGTEPLEIRDCTFTGNLSEEKSYAGGTICYMKETGIILAGNTVMEDNLSVGVEPCDILYFYNTGTVRWRRHTR